MGANNSLPKYEDMNNSKDKDVWDLARQLTKEEKLKLAKELFRDLPIEEKAKIIQEEIRGSGLQVVLGGSNWTSAEIAIQIQTKESIDLSVLFNAAADRISRERRNHSSED